MPGFFLIEGDAHPAALAPGQFSPERSMTAAVHGDSVWLHIDGRIVELVWQDAISHHALEAGGEAGDSIRAPMPGSVVSVAAAPGQSVAKGEPLLVIESMKLEVVIRAPRDGVIEAVQREIGQSFERDVVLVTLIAESAA